MSQASTPSQVFASIPRPRTQALGPALYLIDVLLVLCGLLGVPLFSADIYSGHRMWIVAVLIEEAVAFTVLWVGRRRYRREKEIG